MNAKAELITRSDAVPGDATPMSMLDRAVSQGASVEVLTKLMDLQERWEKNQARRAFDEAVAAAKAEIPIIATNRVGHNEKRYADFAAFARIVDPIISGHGLTYRFRTVQDDKINVTCILAHRGGHYEETTLGGPADTTGSKNAIQAIGSTLTYLQRYSLKQALGLAASDDDDGNASSSGFVTAEQVANLQRLIMDADADIAKFLTFLKVPALADLPAKQYAKAVSALENWAKKAGKAP